MKHIAITGGIGSGKSFVCQRLKKRGIRVYDCDEAAKRLMRQSESLKTALRELVGDKVYTADGRLQKRLLAAFLLTSEANKLAVNNIVHPAVAQDFLDSGMEWLESAILFESGFDARLKFDHVVCVTAPLELRVERVMQRDGIPREKALEWIRCQMPQEEVLRRSDFEIVNDGVSDLEEQIDEILKNIQQLNKQQLNYKKMETILSIAGKPGLFRLVSQGKANLIVETLDEAKKRMPAFGTERITSLGDIAMFTDSEDIPLWKVLRNVGEKEQLKTCSLNFKKASSKELHTYLGEVLPDYDRDRVHDSDIRKLLQWYDILVKNGYTDFKELFDREEEEENEENSDAE